MAKSEAKSEVKPKFIKKLLTNPLSKGESWEKKNTRVIEITESLDNRGTKPNVYFAIIDGKGKDIIEDFFLPTDTAREIAKELIKQADLIDKNYKKNVRK